MIMASLRFSSFGAATIPLSKIIIDKELDMGQYPLIGQKIMAPYRPYTWQTVPFPYDDENQTIVMEGISKSVPGGGEILVVTWTCDTPRPCYVRAIIPTASGSRQVRGARIDINGETVYTTTDEWGGGTTKTTDAIAISPGEVFELYANRTGATGNASIQNCSLVNTGHQVAINLDLEGRFLALKQDFGQLTATLTFGDEADVPFSDYVNRFPYTPDKITFNRHALEDRPVINVYKGV
jgi:hypothetical protein